MSPTIETIGLGGGCHWCTEAVFQSLKGVYNVEQGYIASEAPNGTLSEAVIVHFNSSEIPLEVLIEIHLLTHKSRKLHSMRETYRSAVYVYDEAQDAFAKAIIAQLQEKSSDTIITMVMPYNEFKSSRAEITNYYSKDPKKPFCQRYIEPKLELLRKTYARRMVNN